MGGAERQQWHLARALALAGWKVVVGVAGLRPGQRRTLEGVDFVGIAPGPVLMGWERLLLAERPNWWYWRGASHLYGLTVGIAKLARVGTVFSAAFDRDVQPCQALSWRRRWWPLYSWGLSWTDRSSFSTRASSQHFHHDGDRRLASSTASSVTKPLQSLMRFEMVTWRGLGC